MRRKLIGTIGTLLFLLAGFTLVRWFSVTSYLNEQEKLIKHALRTAESEYPLSNTNDGVDRFLETGELIVEPAYLLDPQKMKEHQMFHMRLSPRVTTHRNDGWVGIQNGNWYVKIP